MHFISLSLCLTSKKKRLGIPAVHLRVPGRHGPCWYDDVPEESLDYSRMLQSASLIAGAAQLASLRPILAMRTPESYNSRAVPEPASFALLITSVLALALVRTPRTIDRTNEKGSLKSDPFRRTDFERKLVLFASCRESSYEQAKSQKGNSRRFRNGHEIEDSSA